MCIVMGERGRYHTHHRDQEQTGKVPGPGQPVTPMRQGREKSAHHKKATLQPSGQQRKAPGRAPTTMERRSQVTRGNGPGAVGLV